MHRQHCAVIAVAFMLLMPGCTDDRGNTVERQAEAEASAAALVASASPTATRPFPCSLFTDAEITQMLGSSERLESQADRSEDHGQQCMWANAREELVLVAVGDRRPGPAPDHTIGGQPIAGIGQSAVVHGDAQLGVWEGTAWLGDRLITVMVHGRAVRKETAVTLLRQTVERL